MSTIRSQDTNDKTEKTEEDTSKIDDSYNEDDKLAFNSKLLLDVNKYQARKRESVDSVDIKYSIDVTNAPKKRLQEYLNSDLLDELEKEPTTTTKVDNTLVNNLNMVEEPKPMIQPQKSYQPYQKKKKNFEIREGDWNCFDCHNLNFSFRIKCNRCGLLKEVSDKKCEEYKMNMMRNMMNTNNANYFNNNNMYFNLAK